MPDLNPDELVNAELKHSLPKQHRSRNQTQPGAETRRFFHRHQRQPHIVCGYFCGPHVRYVLDESPWLSDQDVGTDSRGYGVG
ncbi:hypothetical protein ABZV64_25320 [Streptomyces sp. NPDC004959]|uniref:hypothetical protein n=1 Tax=unclassified Streptomyces TaxID=2593676 RepID=UPI000A74046A|nr:hypothetical protein [Streptomyces sp. NRRL F-5630]